MDIEELKFTDRLFKEQSYLEYTEEPDYTEEDARLEGIMYLQCCGSCKKFKYYLGSGGFCTKNTNDNNIIFVDIMDNKYDL